MLLAVMGLALTLLTLTLLAGGGDLLAASAEALAIGLALGICGALRMEVALAAQTLLIALLGRIRPFRRAGPAPTPAPDLWEPARHPARRAWDRLRAHPALSLLTAQAVGSEALRGLLRPPLSFDSLMYHLLLSAAWLQRQDLAPVLGPFPINNYGYVPANGSIWFWWWLAASHRQLLGHLAP